MIHKVYAVFATKRNDKLNEKVGDPILIWPKSKGRDFIAGKVVECELVVPDGATKQGTTVNSMVK